MPSPFSRGEGAQGSQFSLSWFQRQSSDVRQGRVKSGPEAILVSAYFRPMRALSPRVSRSQEKPAELNAIMIDWLRRHRIGSRALIVNGLTPPGCARCRRTAARERREIATIADQPAWKRVRCPIVQTRLMPSPPRGVAALSAWSRTWIRDS